MARGHKLAEQGLTHSLKKAPGSKKRKKHAAAETAADAPSGTTEASRSSTSNATPNASGNGIKNASTATLTARVLQEQDEKKKRRKMMGNDNLDSLFSKEQKDGAKKSGDFMTRGYSIPAAARR